jgi:hypothetical protein
LSPSRARRHGKRDHENGQQGVGAPVRHIIPTG